MKVITGFVIGFTNGVLWPLLIIYVPYIFYSYLKKKRIKNNTLSSFIRNKVFLLCVWSVWVFFAVFACVEISLYVIHEIYISIENFKQEIGRYIALGVFVGILSFSFLLKKK